MPLAGHLLLSLALLTPNISASQALERVQIQGQRADARATDVSGKIVVQQAELLRLGDSQLSEALKRLPGVSTTPGAPGQPPVLSLRGMAAGYTQILLNGRKTPASFSLDDIAPEQVERVEILRAASSQHSAEALAGSINIVLKPASPKASRQALAEHEASPMQSQSRVQASASGPWRASAASWAWQAQVLRRRVDKAVYSDTQGSWGQQHSREQRGARVDVLSLAPQFSASNGSKWASSLELSQLQRDSDIETLTLDGSPPAYPQHQESYAQRQHKWRGEVSQRWQLSPASELSAELATGLLRQHADFTDQAAQLDDHTWGDLRQRDLSQRLQASWDTNNGHSLSLGAEASQQSRRETRWQTMQGQVYSGLDASATLARWALFVQDEWAPTPRLALTAGLRWEQLRSQSEGQSHRTAVLAPSLHMRWQLPQQSGRLRLALARSFAAPSAAELLPRPFTATNNSPLTPDYQGNPALRPETAWGLDLAYERDSAAGHSFNVGAFARQQRDHKLVELVQLAGRWVERPANVGRASTWGLESDGRWAASRSLALHYNLTHSWSRVQALRHSPNKLADSPTWQFKIGLDLKTTSGWTLAAQLKTRHQAWSPDSLNSRSQSRGDRSLDLNATLRLSPATALRLSLSNALSRGLRERSQWQEGGQWQSHIKQQAQPVLVKVGVEWRG